MRDPQTPLSQRFANKLERNITRRAGKAVHDHDMIQVGDRVLVAVSGGKDSISMLHILHLLQRSSPIAFELQAVTIHQGYEEQDTSALEAHCREHGFPYRVERVPIKEILEEKLQPGVIPCSLCSRIRRGALYSLAVKLGCAKIALGHHLDDLLETLLLNLFYGGQLRSMAPRFRSDDGRNTIIRPLAYVPEALLMEYAATMAFPVTTCATEGCDDNPGAKRQRMKALLCQLDQEVYGLRGNMLRALKNVRGEHLLDPRLLSGAGSAPHDTS